MNRGVTYRGKSMTTEQYEAITLLTSTILLKADIRTSACVPDDKDWLKLGFFGDKITDVLSELELSESQIGIIREFCEKLINAD